MKRVKRTLKRLAPKVLNFFIILLMLFQPVGTPGMLVAIAEGEPAAAVEQAPAPEPEPAPKAEVLKVEAPAPAPAPASAPAPAPVVEEPVPVVTTVVEEPPVVVEPVVPAPATEPAPVVDPVPTADLAQGETEPPVSPETPVEPAPTPETPAPDPQDAPAETPDETPALTEPTVPATDPTEPTSSVLPVTPLDTFAPTLSILGQTSIAPTDQTCLTEGAAITTSAVSDWEVTGDVATTKENVKLGVKYEFPGNKEVSVTFTCLPSITAPLRIEQIKTSDLKLPVGIIPVSEYAYDITTEGMENGTFKYDVTLPKDKNVDADISYIDKSAEEVTNQPITKDELKNIDGTKIDQKSDEIKASGVDHFTVFTITTHEGQLSPSGLYSTGNITTYSEGDDINFRFNLNSDGSGSGTMEVRFTGQETVGQACLFFEQSFILGNIENVSGALPSVSTSGSPTADGDEWVQILNVSFSGVGEARVNYTLTLTEEAGSCGGSSQHASIGDVTGDFRNAGEQKVPVPADKIIEIPEITVIKNIDRDGNGSFEDTADAGEYCFTLDGGSCVSTDSSGQVIFANVTPDGDHSITETQINFSQGTYAFVSGSGTKCTFNGATATATVASGTTSTDATCNFNNAQTQGTLTVNKILSPSDDPGLFNLQIDGSTVGTGANVGNNGTTGAITLSSGNYLVGETAGTATDLADYTSVISGACDAQGNVTVNPGDAKVCTITNTRNTGSVKVNKLLDNNGDGTFETSNPASFNWNLDGSGTNAMGATVSGINTGDHSVNENTVTNYHFVGWYPTSDTRYSCANPQSASLPASISVTKDATTVITLCNARDTGNMKAQKIVDDQSDLTQWTFALDGGNPISADSNGLVDFGQVTTADTHTIVENGPAGYHFVQVTGTNCTDNNDGSADATVSTGGTTVCTFNNDVDKASITIIKDAVPNSEQDFGFTTSGSGLSSFTLDDNGNNSDGTSNTKTFTGLFPGLYSVTETGVIGWDLGLIECTLNQQSLNGINGNTVTRTLNPGDDLTCTFTNTKRGHIIVVKDVISNPDPQDFTFHNNFGNGNDATFLLDEDTNATLPSFRDFEVLPGTYWVSEDTIPGWQQESATCDNGETIGSIDVAAGETVTCTFVNEEYATITLIKNSIGGDDTFDFDATGTGLSTDIDLTTVGGTASQTFSDLDQDNEYSIAENVPAGWDLTSSTCTGTNTPASITPDAGEAVTCTFTNTKDAFIVVDKVTDPSGDPTTFDFTTDYGNPFSLADATTPNNSGDLDPGTYDVTEVAETGWDNTAINCVSSLGDPADTDGQDLDLDAGETITCTFTNTKDAFIVVDKVTDPAGDLTEFDFTTDYGAPFSLADGSASNNSGDLDPGTYSVSEAAEDGWDLTNATCISSKGDTETAVSISLQAGETVTCTFTNTRDTGSITVNKIIDADGDLQTIGDRTDGANWEFDVTGVSTDTSDPAPASTDLTGAVAFSGLKTGQYDVTETTQDGYDLIDANCGEENGSLDGNTVYSVDVSKDTNTVCTFYNTPNGTIHGYKWNDLDGSRSPNGDETKLSGWTINLYRSNGDDGYETDPFKTMDTDDGSEHFGWYWFEHLLPGEYKVCEVLKDGWNQTYPNNEGEDCHFMSLPDGNSNGFFESQNATYGPEYNFGNQFVPPVLTIEKFNDQWPVTQVQGAVIDYTITVRADENNVNEVVVKDLLPEGFSFQSITSVIRNGTDVLSVPNPSYASPGTWQLGDMAAGDEIVIKFKGAIGSAQDPGTYKDLAWAEGTDDSQGEVLATSVPAPTPDDGVITETFVGTQIALAIPTSVAVELNEDEETDTDTRTRRVLGAALPATGASNIWISLVAILATIGGVLMLLGRRKKILANSYVKTVMKVFMMSFLGLALVGFSGTAQAITPLSVRIEDPKSAVNDPNFKIGFVVLDINNDTPSVVCEVDDGGGFVNFPIANVDYTPIAGGNSGDCLVDAGIMPADGSYSFRVTATSSVTVSAGPVAVDLETGAPGTPLNYDRDEHGCTVHFTTANDGLTAKVELYRSTELDFIANESTLAQTKAVPPNTSESIADPLGNCDDYYYAIRAVSAAGAGSGFVGDEKVTVRHRTRTRTITIRPEAAGGAIPVGGAGASGAASGAAGGTTAPGTEGTVGGAETEEGSGVGGGEEGKVLGEEGLKKLATPEGFWELVKNNRWYFLGALALLAFIYYGYRRNKKTIGSKG